MTKKKSSPKVTKHSKSATIIPTTRSTILNYRKTRSSRRSLSKIGRYIMLTGGISVEKPAFACLKEYSALTAACTLATSLDTRTIMRLTTMGSEVSTRQTITSHSRGRITTTTRIAQVKSAHTTTFSKGKIGTITLARTSGKIVRVQQRHQVTNKKPTIQAPTSRTRDGVWMEDRSTTTTTERNLTLTTKIITKQANRHISTSRTLGRLLKET